MFHTEGPGNTTPKIGTNTQAPQVSGVTNKTTREMNNVLTNSEKPLPQAKSISFYQEIKASDIFTGGGGYYGDDESKRDISINFQRKNFEESGFMSYCGKNGESASGFSLATEKFLQDFYLRNRGYFGFTAGQGRPLDSGDYKFWDMDSFSIGEVSFSDGTRSPIYVIGKNGEGVLDEKQVQNFLKLLK